MATTSAQLFAGLIESGTIDTVDIGGPGNRVTLSVARTTEKLYTGDSRTAYATLERERDYTLTFSFTEYTFLNYAYALGQAAANVGSAGSYLLGTTDAPDEVAIVFVIHNEQGSVKDTITMDKCKLAENSEVSWDKGAQGTVEVTFDVLNDDDGHPFKIERAAA